MLAIYELLSGGHEEARRRRRHAIDLDPDSALARGYLGTAYAFPGDYAAALLQLNEAIRLSPCDPMLILWYVGKAWANLTAERFEEAIEFATQGGEANPEFPDIYALLASANGHLGKAAAAAYTALVALPRRMPSLTASDERLDRPFARAADRDRFLEGLRKAGMVA